MWLSRLKRNDKIGLFFFVGFVISMSLIWLFEERFDENSWSAEPSKRYKMVDDLIESQILKYKSKDDVIQLLGSPMYRHSEGQDYFLYRLGTSPSFFESQREQLMVVFENDTVKNVTLAIQE